MTKTLLSLLAVSLAGFSALAQMGGGPGANANNGMDQLFNATPVFTASMNTALSGSRGEMTVASKMYFDHGNARTEMNMANVKGPGLPPGAAARMKLMGMDVVVTIAPAAKTNIFMVYPNINSYVSVPTPGSGSATPNNNVQVTKIGPDTVDGHPCIENKVVVTTSDGQTHEFNTWNASDLKNFPVKITIADQGDTATITFQNVTFDAISASEFQPPSGAKRYDGIPQLMQAAVMSRMGSAAPPAPAAP